MNKDECLKKESTNDGQSIFLYFDDFYDLYVAFGLSAYYSTMVVDPYLTYSESRNLPIAFFDKAQIRIMRQSLKKVEHTQGHSYEFRMRISIGKGGYDKWKNEVKAQHESMY